MTTRKIKDAVDLTANEVIYFKGHAQATYMTDGTTVEDAVNSKVSKVEGKQLSTEDFTTPLKDKLDNLHNYDDSALVAYTYDYILSSCLYIVALVLGTTCNTVALACTCYSSRIVEYHQACHFRYQITARAEIKEHLFTNCS